MRQRIGEKKLAKINKKLGTNFVTGMVRGNTGHRVDLVDSKGLVFGLRTDGSLFCMSNKYSMGWPCSC